MPFYGNDTSIPKARDLPAALKEINKETPLHFPTYSSIRASVDRPFERYCKTIDLPVVLEKRPLSATVVSAVRSYQDTDRSFQATNLSSISDPAGDDYRASKWNGQKRKRSMDDEDLETPRKKPLPGSFHSGFTCDLQRLQKLIPSSTCLSKRMAEPTVKDKQPEVTQSSYQVTANEPEGHKRTFGPDILSSHSHCSARSLDALNSSGKTFPRSEETLSKDGYESSQEEIGRSMESPANPSLDDLALLHMAAQAAASAFDQYRASSPGSDVTVTSRCQTEATLSPEGSAGSEDYFAEASELSTFESSDSDLSDGDHAPL